MNSIKVHSNIPYKLYIFYISSLLNTDSVYATIPCQTTTKLKFESNANTPGVGSLLGKGPYLSSLPCRQAKGKSHGR